VFSYVPKQVYLALGKAIIPLSSYLTINKKLYGGSSLFLYNEFDFSIIFHPFFKILKH
jgi:hypothetical protein